MSAYERGKNNVLNNIKQANKQFNKINYSQLRHWNERKIIEEIVTPFIL